MKKEMIVEIELGRIEDWVPLHKSLIAYEKRLHRNG
jgi:hypothetical protein